MVDFESELERELQIELEKLEQIFHDEKSPAQTSTSSSNAKNGKVNLSLFDLAAAEGEKEELQDRLQLLLSKTEEFDFKFSELNQENFLLRSEIESSRRENDELRKELAELRRHQQNVAKQESMNNSVLEFRNLEFKLAETRAKLARTQQALEDLTLAKDFALKELEQERVNRTHVEKERDAYSAAYEASLNHFEKWSKAKVKQ